MIPLTILGWSGRKTVYGEFAFSPLREPGLKLVLQGIHEGVYPWNSAAKEEEEE